MGQVFCCVQVKMSTVNIKDKGLGQVYCCVTIEDSKMSIKENLDESEEDAVRAPGCQYLPWIHAAKLDGVQRLDVRCSTKTKDNVSVNVVANVQYRALANKASDTLYKINNERSQIQAHIFDVIRVTLPKLSLDDAFERKNEIAKAVKEELEKAMSAFGYEIVQTLIVDIETDEEHVNEIDAGLKAAANKKVETGKILQINPTEGEVESNYLSGVAIGR